MATRIFFFVFFFLSPYTICMENMNRCYYDQLVEQIRSQKLDSNVLFGPINSLTQKDFLEVENVKFFITLGLDTSQLSQVWNNGPLNSDNSVVINFDPNFDYNGVDTETRFFDENAENLRKIVAHVMRADDDSSTQQYLRSLVNSDVTSLGTVYNGSWEVQIRNLLDIAIIFKLASGYGKLLIVSKNGNDNVLVSLLVALQIIQNPHLSVLEAFKFIKVQRPSVQELAPEFVSLCSSLGGTPLSGSTPDKQGRKFEQMDYLTSKRSRVSD
ncbi:hypothetical protein ZYGM_003397 [Zygosaccharomyces mellis]|uniref:Uncharacterized protein n=1 Tax=Zygosaccharomyces mellis TaxID=42258 RepID=A0A4C2E024_9SACH|nr:hypothetical protein ZYGM_003397 [Zygosaccharomyces mellis]